jgi:predicted metal-dependent hydrolase
MLSPLQTSPQSYLATALERIAGDKVTCLQSHDRWASTPDALACYWDELFNAVCARLEHLAEESAQPPLQTGMFECVAALEQLHASVIDERARHRQQALDVAALRPQREHG